MYSEFANMSFLAEGQSQIEAFLVFVQEPIRPAITQDIIEIFSSKPI
jgi:hypothetical protein